MWGSEEPKPSGNQDKVKEEARKATQNKHFIKLGLGKYIDYWRDGMSRCEGFSTAFGPYVEYWNGILIELEQPLPKTPSELLEGFWPQHDWKVL